MMVTTDGYLCKAGSSSVCCSGSRLGITPMMVLFSEVPLSSRCRTSCMFRGESTLKRPVEPGRRTPSWVSSSGRRPGIRIPGSDVMSAASGSRWTFAIVPELSGNFHFRTGPFRIRSPVCALLKRTTKTTSRPQQRPDLFLVWWFPVTVSVLK